MLLLHKDLQIIFFQTIQDKLATWYKKNLELLLICDPNSLNELQKKDRQQEISSLQLYSVIISFMKRTSRDRKRPAALSIHVEVFNSH